MTHLSRLLVASVLSAATAQAFAEPLALALRGDVTASRDALTLADLVENVPPELGRTPVFRAPELGASGTIQASRIVAVAEGLGLGPVETGGRTQVAVTRAARTVGATEIEAAIRKVLAREHGQDPIATGIAFDAPTPAMVVAPDLAGEVAASDVTFDRRTRRVSATVWLGPAPTVRRAQIRASGVAVDTVEVAVAGRALERGQQVRGGDLVIERRARDLVPPDAAIDGSALEGRIARRQLAFGALVRASDLAKPEIVARGDLVNVVYEVPGIALTLRGKATESGALGDTVPVVNPQNKKVLQAVVIGPGRVSVAPEQLPGRIAAARLDP